MTPKERQKRDRNAILVPLPLIDQCLIIGFGIAILIATLLMWAATNRGFWTALLGD